VTLPGRGNAHFVRGCGVLARTPGWGLFIAGRERDGEPLASSLLLRAVSPSLVQLLSDLRWRSELRLKAVFCRDQYGFAG